MELGRLMRPSKWAGLCLSARPRLSAAWLAVLLVPQSAHGQASVPRSSPLPRIEYPEEAQRVGALDYSVVGASALTAILARSLGPRQSGPQVGILFDHAARSALRLDSPSGRHAIATSSDVMMSAALAYGALVDPWLHVAALRQSPDTAWQIFWINSEVISVTFALQQLTSNIVGRERPLGSACTQTGLTAWEEEKCLEKDRYRSFFSGHMSVPMSIAVASCVHHTQMPLSGNYGALTCGLGIGFATTTGAFRVLSDKHYSSDVILGAFLGAAVGFIVPWLHYRPSARLRRPSTVTWAPLVVAQRGRLYSGLTISGVVR